MNMNEYQRKAAETAIYPNQVARMVQSAQEGARDFDSIARLMELSYVALGLAGEAGEFANKVKKLIRDAGGVISTEAEYALIDELGDQMWYIADACRILGWNMGFVADRNLMKLSERARLGKLPGAGDDR